MVGSCVHKNGILPLICTKLLTIIFPSSLYINISSTSTQFATLPLLSAPLIKNLIPLLLISFLAINANSKLGLYSFPSQVPKNPLIIG